MIEEIKNFQTYIFDLDWNRHVTSRTYEKFCLDARYQVLKSLGFPIEKCIQEKIYFLELEQTCRFLKEQHSGKSISVETKLQKTKTDKLIWNQIVFGENKIKSCEIRTINKLCREGKTIQFEKLNLIEEPKIISKEFQSTKNSKFKRNFYIPFTDINFFWELSTDSIWKIFEEGRFLFFKESGALEKVQITDTSTFFMGGEISIIEKPKPGEDYILESWIETVEKIRFYFRQDLVDQNGKVYLRMRDEQVFVSLSQSKPKRLPEDFLSQIKSYIE